MFFDKFKFKLVEIDDEPVTDGVCIVWHSSGKVERIENGVACEPTPDEVRKHIAQLTEYYLKAKSASVPVGPARVTVGRIVHYTSLGDADGKYPAETQAAVVTGVNADGTAALKILYRTGIFDMPSVPYAAVSTRGHWNWPPKV